MVTTQSVATRILLGLDYIEANKLYWILHKITIVRSFRKTRSIF